jgi:hypothetical protein
MAYVDAARELATRGAAQPTPVAPGVPEEQGVPQEQEVPR